MGCGVGPQLQELLQKAVLDPELAERGRQVGITPQWETVGVSLLLPDTSE